MMWTFIILGWLAIGFVVCFLFGSLAAFASANEAQRQVTEPGDTERHAA